MARTFSGTYATSQYLLDPVTDNPATVRASTPATTQATVALRKNPVSPRCPLPEGTEDGPGEGGQRSHP